MYALLPPVALGVLLVVLTVQAALGAGPMIAVDEAVRDGVGDLASGSGPDRLDGVMHVLADLGGPIPGGIALAAGYVAAAWRTSGRGTRVRLAATAAVSVAVVSLAVITGKILIARPGPDGRAVASGDWGFFPSGHTATSAVCFGASALLLGTVLSAPARRRVYAGTSLLCVLIGFALLWCGYHWLGDVLASWSLCVLVLWAAARSVSRGSPPGRDRPSALR
ncbi:MAG TPA: phosphatase PAP2 family protein [Yinghuangia sp.]|nr:phosphatase PAP2 family protein [Yinghuangia sp.]